MNSRPLFWYDFASNEEKIKTAEHAMLGPHVSDVASHFAPNAEPKIMLEYAKKLFDSKMLTVISPGKHYSSPSRSVVSQLPIWC